MSENLENLNEKIEEQVDTEKVEGIENQESISLSKSVSESADNAVETSEVKPMVTPIVEPISQPKVEQVSQPIVEPASVSNPYTFTPLEVKKKEKPELSGSELLLKQNNILKWLCVVLAAFSVLTLGLSIFDYVDNSKTNLLVSDSNRSEAILTAVDTKENTKNAAQIYADNLDSIVTIQTEIITQNFFQQSVGIVMGSGFVISEDGYILTNAHVIEGARKITVTFESGDSFEAQIVGQEEDNDLAVIKIEPTFELNPVVMGNSDNIVIGEDVFAIGNPLGELTFSITKGIVSAIDRQVQIDTFNSINMFQVDCAVNEGNSGGPIFNAYGEVIGVVSAKYASETIEGLGFCIPITDALNIVTDLIQYGKVVDKAYMGVQVTDISETMIQQYNMVAGAYISVIDDGSCAQKAGLKIGDIIVELGGTKVDSVNALLIAKREYKAGDTVNIKVYRSGEYVDLTITFDEYKEQIISNPFENNNNNNSEIQEYPNDFGGIEDFYNYYNQYGGDQNSQSELEDYLYDYFFGGQR